MELEIGTIIAPIVTFLIGLAGTIPVFIKGKKKVGKVVILLKEVYEAGKAVDDALADDKLTKEEVDVVAKEFADVKEAVKLLLEKEVA